MPGSFIYPGMIETTPAVSASAIKKTNNSIHHALRRSSGSESCQIFSVGKACKLDGNLVCCTCSTLARGLEEDVTGEAAKGVENHTLESEP